MLLTIDEACNRLKCGRTLLYRAMNEKEDYRQGLPHLRSVKLGGKRLISEVELIEYVKKLG